MGQGADSYLRSVTGLLGYSLTPTPLYATSLNLDGTLRSFLFTHAWPVDLALPLLAQAAIGLAVLHSKGIAHGSIGLDSIVLDLGIKPHAKITGLDASLLSKPGQHLDSLEAIRRSPPEYFDEEPASTASDVWMFAMGMWTALSAGAEPFEKLGGKIAVSFLWCSGSRQGRADAIDGSR
jgi:serine/threonine protein kinase